MIVIGDRGWMPGRLLCIGAHSDDIEIGAGGTILKLLATRPDVSVDWIVLTARGERIAEAEASAARFLEAAAERRVAIHEFRERYFPHAVELKEFFDELGRTVAPDVILCPTRDDAHQDHRTVSELVAATFRDHLVLEYEIPKYDGDLGRPSIYVHLDRTEVGRKVALLAECFPSQQERPWFTEDTFRGLMRLRGIESRAPSGYAEAFHCRKLVLA